jgi:hypothetical protein
MCVRIQSVRTYAAGGLVVRSRCCFEFSEIRPNFVQGNGQKRSRASACVPRTERGQVVVGLESRAEPPRPLGRSSASSMCRPLHHYWDHQEHASHTYSLPGSIIDAMFFPLSGRICIYIYYFSLKILFHLDGGDCEAHSCTSKISGSSREAEWKYSSTYILKGSVRRAERNKRIFTKRKERKPYSVHQSHGATQQRMHAANQHWHW